MVQKYFQEELGILKNDFISADEIRYLEVNSTVLSNAACNAYFFKTGKRIESSQMCLMTNLYAVPGICEVNTFLRPLSDFYFN